ncbi:MAG TPA: adenylate cyclase regulatory domain-containing protein [Solirubrobacteraceae bacterium]
MGIDFAAEGLLDGLEGDARAARVELLEQLTADGVVLDDLRAATRDGRLVFLGAERVVSGIPRYSTREVGARTGVRPEFIMALRRANGLPVPSLDAVVCSEADIDAATTARHFLAAGVTEEQQLAVVRVLGRGLAQAAEVMRSTVLELVLEPGASEAEFARAYAERVDALMPLVGPMLEQMIRLHLRHTVRTEAISAAERTAGVLPGAREVTVGFADLVGFTRLGEEVAPDELGRVAERLVEMAGEHLRGDVRMVKTIGDAAMLVSPDPPTLLAVALDLVDAADAEGRDFPQLRVGVASGPALNRAGDWYGRPVNIASRVTAIARPGSVLATRDVRDAANAAYRWSSAGARSLKGVEGPVRLYRARRLATGEDAGGYERAAATGGVSGSGA